MLDLLVSGESIGSAEGLVVVAKFATSFLAVGVVNSILMASKIVGSREDGVAGLSGCWVDSRTLVRTGLVGSGNMSRRHSVGGRVLVDILLVLCKFGGTRESLSASTDIAGVRSAASLWNGWLGKVTGLILLLHRLLGLRRSRVVRILLVLQLKVEVVVLKWIFVLRF